MRAIRYTTRVRTGGRIALPRVQLRQGTAVEVIVLVGDTNDESADLLSAAEGTLGFWDNPTDDEVWNDA